MKKVILGGMIFIGGAIMYSTGILGFAHMDIHAGIMQTPRYLGIAVMAAGLALGWFGLKKD